MAARGAVKENYDFYNSGPTHFVGTTIDWENAHHRRIITSSLVQAVYALKNDQNNERGGEKALAPHWWKCFNFEKMEDVYDRKDRTIFGAIFKLHSPNDHNNTAHNSTIRPPKFIVAFRGTSLSPDSAYEDLKLDLKCVINLVHESHRVEVAMSVVEKIVDENSADPKVVWLAGHSLGAAIALSVGRDIVLRKGIYLETHLFNPPCIHFPIATLSKTSPRFKRPLRVLRSLVTAALATVQAIIHKDDQTETKFSRLSKWIPYIYLNDKDRISSEYLHYFKHREEMAKVGLGKIEKEATQNSITSLIPGARPSHLLPVAYIISNLSTDIVSFREAHALKQWWVPQQHYFKSKIYDKFWEVDFGAFSS